MKKGALKFISLVLVMAVITTCCVIAGVSASAASGDVIYFDNSVTKFSMVYCYMWEGGSNGNWPGQPMTNVSGDIWAYNVPDNSTMLIFNGGNGQKQSVNLSYPGNNKIGEYDGVDGDKFKVAFSDYTGSETLPSQTTSATQATTPSGSAGKIYCQNEKGWSSVYCYMWNSESDKNAGWPGVKMTDIGGGVYEYSFPKSYANVIFSNNGSDQTGDINNWASLGGDMYNNKTGAWGTYVYNPVTIPSLSTSLASPSYTGCSITISAVAKSDESANLNYKFTANSAVLSDGPYSSVVWVPTNAGTYTLGVEVTDGAGNTATRSIKFEVKSSEGLAEAYIRAFTNSLGTRSQIKRGSAITFTSDAIGGQTGNYTLFYKFRITDPDGIENTAYYTTDNKYTYTPTKLGTYTVKAFVQNAYNSTVTNTYTYTSVDEINEQDETSATSATQETSATTHTQETSPPQTTPGPSTTTKPTESSATQTTAPIVDLRGDANGDGKVNITDVTWIQMYLVDIEYYLDNLNTKLADVTGDNEVKIQDANMIQRYLAGIISEL